jgi:hemerythrin-like domain-containing protein
MKDLLIEHDRDHDHGREPGRRTVLRRAAGAGLALAFGGAPRAAAAKPKGAAPEVSPTEDLMREHGILRRLLLVYGEAIRRLETREELAPETVARSAEIIRTFIEDYHERDEENYIFPRFVKAGKMVDLVNTLLLQHQAGRKLTVEILRLSTTAGLGRPADRQRLGESMRLFIRMYEPHAAREDTVLFPAFRELVGPKELDRLQDVFEDKEKALPGGGFETVVVEVAKIEQTIGFLDLARFTPKAV